MPLATFEDAQVASHDEVVTAFEGLSHSDLARLRQLARLRSFKMPGQDWEDLLSEAVSRVLAGSRRWPKSVPFIAFMAQTMRSVADEQWERLKREGWVLEGDLESSDGEMSISLAELAVDEVDPLRLALARSALAGIARLFAQDADALKVLQGMAEGLSPEEIMQSAQMGKTAYATTQRRIRRTLAKHPL